MSSREENVGEAVRADVWLWAVRIYRTRNLASGACRKGQVRIQGQAIKPARLLRSGDEVQVERGYLTARYRVRTVLDQRVGAKEVADFLEDLTPEEEREKAKRLAELNRPPQGAASGNRGRPTKKERRQREQWTEGEPGPAGGEEWDDLWKSAIR